MAEIYERLPGESVKAFAAFQAYREMEGHGTYAKLAHTLGKSKSLIGRWATKWRWQERLRAYLNHLDHETLKNRDRELREMRKRHATFGRALMSTGAKSLERINQKLADGPKAELGLDDIIRMIHEGAELERKALNIEELQTIPILKPTVDVEPEEELRRIHAKIIEAIGIGVPSE